MKTPYRTAGLLVIIGLGMLIILTAPQSALVAGKPANPFLNKTAVGPDTPYIVLGMGCFWGSEKRMQTLAGVLDVEAGYAGGDLPNPDYELLHDTELQIRGGKAVKNHAEVVKVYYDPKQTTLEKVLIQFWENHNPTQGDRQGNDIGSNYRSAVFYRTENERRLAEKTRAVYQADLRAEGIDAAVTTEIAPLNNYAAAEDYHQDYLEKNPLGYCGLGGTGVAYADPAAGPHQTATPIAGRSASADWDTIKLNDQEQLIAFEAEDCGYCRRFDRQVLSGWRQPVPIRAVNSAAPPPGWTLKSALFATPTVVLFKNGREVARHTGYQGPEPFWRWLRAARKEQPIP